MESLLQGVEGVSVNTINVLVAGSSIEKHLFNLDTVLAKFRAVGLKLNKAKCSFLRPSIEYLGHVIDEKGLHPTPKKVTAIQEAQSHVMLPNCNHL